MKPTKSTKSILQRIDVAVKQGPFFLLSIRCWLAPIVKLCNFKKKYQKVRVIFGGSVKLALK